MFYIFTINGTKHHIANQILAGVAALSGVVNRIGAQTQKVVAIKLIRTFDPSMGLKEAKELTEYIWEHADFPDGLLELNPKIESVHFHGTTDFLS